MKALALLLLLATSSPPARSVNLIGERITTKEFDGVVVYPAAIDESEHWWVPSRADIVRAETALRLAIPRSTIRSTRVARELSRYKRQYQAVRKNGEKTI